jgi:hypothetical protein
VESQGSELQNGIVHHGLKWTQGDRVDGGEGGQEGTGNPKGLE